MKEFTKLNFLGSMHGDKPSRVTSLRTTIQGSRPPSLRADPLLARSKVYDDKVDTLDCHSGFSCGIKICAFTWDL